MTIVEQVQRSKAELESLLSSLERIDEDEHMAMRFALVHGVKALRMCISGEGNTPSGRRYVQSIERMCAAAAGMDHG